jgi:hypothetical protein
MLLSFVPNFVDGTYIQMYVQQMYVQQMYVNTYVARHFNPAPIL